MKRRHSPQVMSLAEELGYVPLSNAVFLGGCIILGTMVFFSIISYVACYVNAFPQGLCQLDDGTFRLFAITVGAMIGFGLALVHSLIWYSKNLRALTAAIARITEEVLKRKSNCD